MHEVKNSMKSPVQIGIIVRFNLCLDNNLKDFGYLKNSSWFDFAKLEISRNSSENV
jgi:hypothetical protein